MKLSIKNLVHLPSLITGLLLALAGQVAAQNFTTLHSFAGPQSDGMYPMGRLIVSGNTVYGTTWLGGYYASGTVFKVNTDGTKFTILHSFSGGNEGDVLFGGLILSGDTLYGTTMAGGIWNTGIVFAIKTNGNCFTNLYSFDDDWPATNSDGAEPWAGLILSGDTLFGMARGGGSSGNGTIFGINIDGTGFTNLHSFGGYDGNSPEASLILSSNTLFGTTLLGGSSGNGTVFAINVDGTGFTNLYNFTAVSSDLGANNDGAYPWDALILCGETLYGTARGGGVWGNGTVFAIKANGSCFTNLHSFTLTVGSLDANSDGSQPWAGLILSGNTLYGTTTRGGSWGVGTIFAVHTNGSCFTTVHSFTRGSDGYAPFTSLTLSGNILYGVTQEGGNLEDGTLFGISFTPQITIRRLGENVVLTWPTNVDGFNYSGFTLQSTPELSPVAWSTNLPAPIVINGQYTVTNSISGTQQFYELSQ